MKSFKCGECGKRHPGLPTDYCFREPDAVYPLSYVGKYMRVRKNEDLCTLDEARYFLRGCLSLPFIDQKGDFTWGIWVEVSEDHHNVYAGQMYDKTFQPFRLDGRIANAIPGYRSTLKLRVNVLLEDGRKVPTLWLPPRSRHKLAREQQHGISGKRHHQLLEGCGFFEK